MTETVFFCSQIVNVMLAGFGSQRDLLNNFYTINLKAANLLGIVGQYFYFPQSQVATDLSTNPIVAFVCSKA